MKRISRPFIFSLPYIFYFVKWHFSLPYIHLYFTLLNGTFHSPYIYHFLKWPNVKIKNECFWSLQLHTNIQIIILEYINLGLDVTNVCYTCTCTSFYCHLPLIHVPVFTTCIVCDHLILIPYMTEKSTTDLDIYLNKIHAVICYSLKQLTCARWVAR